MMSKADTSVDEYRTILKSKARFMLLMDFFVMGLISVGMAIALLFIWTGAEKQTISIMRAKEITALTSNLSKRIYDAGVALGGFSVTRSKLFLHRFDKTIGEIPHEVSELKDLIRTEDKKQFDALAKVADLLPDAIKQMDAAKVAVMEGQGVTDRAGFRSTFLPMNSMAQEIQENLKMIAEENKDLANSKVPNSLPNQQLFVLVTIFGFLILLGLVLKSFFLIKLLPRG